MISDFSREKFANTLGGRNQLSTAFWVHFAYGQIVLMLGLLMVGSSLYLLLPAQSATSYSKWLTYVLGFGYQILAAIGVWRCAFNVRHRFWGHSARTFVIVYVASAVIALTRSSG